MRGAVEDNQVVQATTREALKNGSPSTIGNRHRSDGYGAQVYYALQDAETRRAHIPEARMLNKPDCVRK